MNTQLIQIYICNRSQINQAVADLAHTPHVVISATDHRSSHPSIQINDNTLGLVRVKFDDVTEDDQHYKSISSKEADIIYHAYYTYRDYLPVYIINCDAGISRSAGVASALSLLEYGCDSNYEHLTPSEPHPNRTVFHSILRSAGYGTV